MDELVAEFISEASENLQTLDNKIVELEQNPENEALLSSIFRIMHTIKGTCGFLGLNKLASVAHAGENVMDKIRSKQLSVDSAIVSIILEVIDAIKEMVSAIAETGLEPETDYFSLIERLTAIAKNENANEKDKASSKAPEQVNIETEKNKEVVLAALSQSQESQQLKQEDKEKKVPLVDSKIDTNIAQTIRVNVEVLEGLMQIVSELVLNRNQLIQLDRSLKDSRFTSPIQRLNVITSSLQETVMSTRLQPIGSAWVKVPRMIRDLSKDLNKKIKLVMIGEDTELDRQLIESIKDPLVHMIRNAADHGLETSAERLAAKKSEEGTITLKAYHEGGHIIIEVSDDGKGLNTKKIRNKILQTKLATEKELDGMSDSQINQFIFRAGFSTAEKVTEVSGRGVGMDVVKKNIDSIRGSIELQTIEGKGSTFVIKIPLTLAIMPILIVEAAGYKFGIPQIAVLEMVKSNKSSDNTIEEINGHKVLRLRESLLPLITLSELLQIKQASNNEAASSFIVVCEAGGTQFGLVVDKIYDTEEIVLKPISKLLKSIDVYSGNTLLGSGEVIMILDAAGIIKYLTVLHHEDLDLSSLAKQNKKLKNKTSTFIVLKERESFRAIPLELVSRLEEIDVSKIETTGGKQVIQYRGSLMFLAKLDPGYIMPKEGKQQVVVFGSGRHILGLIVEEIVDIAEQSIDESIAFEENDLNAIVLNGKTMDLVDINYFLHQHFSSDTPEKLKKLKQEYNLLIVDDSPFFRKIVSTSLRSLGFNLFSAETAEDALAMLKAESTKIHLIITDINMPQMNGFEFGKACKADAKLKHIPIVAITSNIELANNNKNLESSGIESCIAKTNQDELIKCIYNLLKI